MVCTAQHDELLSSCVRACHTQGQIVRFAARVDEVADRQRIWKRGGEAPGVADEVLVQIACVGVQNGGLLGDGRHNARVLVADVGNVVDAVEEAVSVHVEQKRAASTHDVQR